MYVCAMCATSPPYTQKICRNRTDITDHLLSPSRTSVLMPCGTVRTGPYVTITVMEMETLRLGSTAELPAEPRETVVIKIVRDLLSSPLAAPRWTANKGLERFYNTITRLLYFCFGLPIMLGITVPVAGAPSEPQRLGTPKTKRAFGLHCTRIKGPGRSPIHFFLPQSIIRLISR